MRYEDVGADEAIDLIGCLPQGSRWAAATDPMRAWSDEHHWAADVVDAITLVAYRLGAFREAVSEPPRVTRPADDRARARARRRAAAAARLVESGGWEEM